MVSFLCCPFFPPDVLDEILVLIEPYLILQASAESKVVKMVSLILLQVYNCTTEPSCSKLTTSLVNVSLNFQTLI